MLINIKIFILLNIIIQNFNINFLSRLIIINRDISQSCFNKIIITILIYLIAFYIFIFNINNILLLNL